MESDESVSNASAKTSDAPGPPAGQWGGEEAAGLPAGAGAAPSPVADGAPLWILALGASAGGLEALRQVVPLLPVRRDLCVVVAQHTSAEHRSLLAELLGRETLAPVCELVDGARLVPGSVQVVPSGMHARLEQGRWALLPASGNAVPKPSIDMLFESVAQFAGPRALAAVLSGTGSDGSRGLRAVRAAGGCTLAQDPATARHAGMPRHAVDTGLVDFVVAPSKLAEVVLGLIERQAPLPRDGTEEGSAARPDDEEAHWEAVARTVGAGIGFDLRAYRTSSLRRRARRRMRVRGCGTVQAYAGLLAAEPEEQRRLIDELLISVTGFFRDADVFAALPAVLESMLMEHPGTELRLWVAGCATGEEAYSLALLLADARQRLQLQRPVRIFATDIDSAALATARLGRYPLAALADVPEPLHGLLQIDGESFRIGKATRDLVLFSQHDVLRDPPFLRQALVSCRNLLIYFTPESQGRTLHKFCTALDAGGLLLLGRTEGVPPGMGLEPQSAVAGADPVRNLYRLLHRPAGRPPAALPAPTRVVPPRLAPASPAAPSRLPAAAQALLAAHELGMFGGLAALGPQGQVEHVFGDVRRWLQLGAGGASLEVMQLAAPGLRLDLQVLLRRAAQQRDRRVSVVADPGHGEPRVRIFALAPAGSPTTLLAFEPMGDAQPPGAAVEPDERVSALQGQLQATREHLQSLVSELDAANEQLQGLNEELQSSNEELQSSNEELETANEELQATNEELLTVNQELQSRSAELSQTNADLRNVMASLADPLIVIDEHGRLLQRNPASNVLFAAPAEAADAGVVGLAPAPPLQLFALPWRVPSEAIALATRALLNGGAPPPVAVAGPEDRRWQLRLLPYLQADGRRRGAVLLFIETTSADRLAAELQAAVQRLELSESFRRATVDALADELCVLDHEGRIVQANVAWQRGIDEAGAQGARDADVGGNYLAACERSAAEGDVLAAAFLAGLLAVRAGAQRQFRQEYPCQTPAGLRWYRVTVTAFADGRPFLVLLHQDITALRQQLERIELNARALDSALNGIVISDARDPPLPIVYVNRAFVEMTGYPEAEVLGRSCSFLQGNDRNQPGVARLREAIARRQNCQVLLRNYRRDGSAFWNELTLSMVRDAQGLLTHMVGVQRDVTQLIASEEALKAAQRREAQALAFAGVGTLSWRIRDGLVSMSRQHARLLALDEKLQLPWEDLRRRVHPDDLPAFDDAVKLCVAGHAPLDIEWRCRAEEGWRWLRTQGDVERDADGTALDLAAISQDIGARRAAEERAAHLAQHDALTGLPNRSLLRDRLQVAIRNASRSRARLAVLFIDLDRFKEVNDSLGHEFGDALLRAVAHRLKSGLRDSDTVSRLGGDEFVLLLPGVRDADEARQVADKLLEAVGSAFELDGRAVQVGASIGVALYPEDGTDADTLTRHADAAMYRAKGAGRNTVRFFSQLEDDAAQQALARRAALRDALHAGELRLVYQPQVACADGRLLGVEALLRWQHPSQGLLAPDAFLPTAEDTPLIDEIGRWVLEQACAQAVRWRGTPLGGVPVAVNVSPHQLRSGGFLRALNAALGSTGALPAEIELEITERAILHDDEASRAVLADIRAMGVALALDDFGTGYSSLSHLYQTPLSRIKIDRSFCSALPGNRNAEAIVAAVVQMARSIGLTIIAEGVETPEQLQHLRQAGCSGVQGYLVLRPMPPGDLAPALVRRRGELGWADGSGPG